MSDTTDKRQAALRCPGCQAIWVVPDFNHTDASTTAYLRSQLQAHQDATGHFGNIPVDQLLAALKAS